MIFTLELDDAIICGVTWLIVIPSLVVAAVTLFLTFRNGKMNTSLLMLTTSLTICDCCMLLIFALWTAPMTMWHRTDNTVYDYGKITGAFAMLFWYGSLDFLLAIAINRFIAMSKPMKYNTLMSTKRSSYFTVFFWIISLAQAAVFLHPDCSGVYDPEWYSWSYSDNICGQTYGALMQDMILGNLIGLIMFTINLVTLHALRKSNKVTTVCKNPILQSNIRRKREVRFFKQAACNTFFVVFCLVSISLFSRFVTTKYGLYCTTVLPWILSHASNGYISIALQPEIRARWRDLLAGNFRGAFRSNTSHTNSIIKSAKTINLTRNVGHA